MKRSAAEAQAVAQKSGSERNKRLSIMAMVDLSLASGIFASNLISSQVLERKRNDATIFSRRWTELEGTQPQPLAPSIDDPGIGDW